MTSEVPCADTTCLHYGREHAKGSSNRRRGTMSTEAAVRSALKEYLMAAQKPELVAVNEFWVPQSHERADLALIGRELKGYEIKTERDTLLRLPRQALAYGRIFDRCTVVVASRHVEGAIRHLPEWWGVTEISTNGHVNFTNHRSARRNADLDPETLVRLLWRSEVMSALSKLGIDLPANASRMMMWQTLLDRADMRELRGIVRRALRHRDGRDARIRTRRFTQVGEDEAN